MAGSQGDSSREEETPHDQLLDELRSVAGADAERLRNLAERVRDLLHESRSSRIEDDSSESTEDVEFDVDAIWASVEEHIRLHSAPDEND